MNLEEGGVAHLEEGSYFAGGGAFRSHYRIE